jgi:predicted DCC family thiol-disulfide oxidoreductase YuxK
MKQVKASPAGWILHDVSCGFSRRWVPFLAKTLQRRGFEIAPLQADWVKDRLPPGETDLLQDLRLLLANGERIRGADVCRYAIKQTWRAYPIYIFSVLPLGRNVFDWGCRKFAVNRYRMPRICKLP